MDTKVELKTEGQTALDRIESLLKELTPESLVVVEQFVRFVNEQARRGQPIVSAAGEQPGKPPYKYPTIALPAESMRAWTNLLPRGYEGDALADTEALYDDP